MGMEVRKEMRLTEEQAKILRDDKERFGKSSRSMILGCDPDLKKSGIATLQNGILKLQNLTFTELVEYLMANKTEIKKVVVEAGWLNEKSNWHNQKNAQIAAKIGKNVGENHATGKLICEMALYLGFVVELVRPTTRKLDAEQFKSVTGYEGRTNQEQRDAALLIWKGI